MNLVDGSIYTEGVLMSNLDTLQIVPGSHKRSRVPAQVLVVILHIKTQAEENVVPDEHLHLCLLPGVDGHHVSWPEKKRRYSENLLSLR